MTELQKRYRYTGPMSQRNHAEMMARIDAARELIDRTIAFNFSEVLLYAIGRITPTPDDEMPPAEIAAGCGEWTGD